MADEEYPAHGMKQGFSCLCKDNQFFNAPKGSADGVINLTLNERPQYMYSYTYISEVGGLSTE